MLGTENEAKLMKHEHLGPWQLPPVLFGWGALIGRWDHGENGPIPC